MSSEQEGPSASDSIYRIRNLKKQLSPNSTMNKLEKSEEWFSSKFG